MDAEPKWKHGRRGLYCYNMHELIEAANNIGLSDLDIAQKVGAAQSTVRNWRKTTYGDKKFARKLFQLIRDTKKIEPVNQPVQESEHNTKTPDVLIKIEHSTDEAQFFKEFRQLSEKAENFGYEVSLKFLKQKD